MEDIVETLIQKVESQKYHCLNISHRDLTFLPQGLKNIANLKILLLNNNKLVLPPAELLSLSHCLEELVLDCNNFTLLPSGLGEFKKLTLLSVNCTSIGALHPEIGKLVNLRELWLNECSLFALPKEIGSLQRLTKLGLRQNQIAVVPGEIGKLKSLRWISVAKNDISFLPREFSNLQNLRYADFSGNKFENIPDSLLGISKLRVLLLSHNRISHINDDVLLGIASMVKVDLRQNPMMRKPDHWKGMEFILVGNVLEENKLENKEAKLQEN